MHCITSNIVIYMRILVTDFIAYAVTLHSLLPVALRKIDSIHHPSVDKTNQPPEPIMFQKTLQSLDTPPKVPLADRPQPGDVSPKPQPSELPPKPGELPPKPQLSDLPPKPQLGDLPPKPHLKDLPPKPHLADISPPKPVYTEVIHKPPAGEVATKPQPPDTPTVIHQGEPSPQPVQYSEDTNGSPTSAQETPVPLPRKINPVRILCWEVLDKYFGFCLWCSIKGFWYTRLRSFLLFSFRLRVRCEG